MGQLILDISMSLDGFVAGPNPTLEEPLGVGGEALHEWVIAAASWRASHGKSGGEEGPDAEVIAETLGRIGATIMGRRMFSGGAGPWEDDPNADGWWGDEPPFGHPVFVLTHHAREPLEKAGGTTFTFVTEGAEAALAAAREAAGGKDVLVAGGADVAQQYLAAGLLDELQLHVAPLLLGDGVRLFADGPAPARARADPDDRLARRHAPALSRPALRAEERDGLAAIYLACRPLVTARRSRRSPRTRGRPSPRRARRARSARRAPSSRRTPGRSAGARRRGSSGAANPFTLTCASKARVRPRLRA